jgi:WD40 repeat protein
MPHGFVCESSRTTSWRRTIADQSGIRNLGSPSGYLDPAARREVARLHGHDDRVFWLDFTPEDRALISTSLDGTFRIWDALPAGGPGGTEVQASVR